MSAYIKVIKALELFKLRTPSLRLGLSAEDAAYALSKLDEKAKEYAKIATEIAKETNDDENEIVLNAIRIGKHEILSSAMSLDLIEQYKTQIRAFRNYDELWTFLESILQCKMSKDEEVEAARRKLSDAVRFNMETFTLFLQRLNSVAAPIKKNTSNETAELFVKDCFTKNLGPKLKIYLRDHAQNSKSLSEVALFLDTRGKHLPNAQVNTIGVPEIEELRAQNDQLQKQIFALTDLVSSKFGQQSPSSSVNTDTVGHVQVNKISAPRRETRHMEAKPLAPAGSSMKADAYLPNQGPGRFARGNTQIKQGRRPIRCYQCGLLGHIARMCPRTCSSICHNCGKVGHLQAVCPMAKNL